MYSAVDPTKREPKETLRGGPSLLERKPDALGQAAPLRGWKLDPAFAALHRLLEGRFGPRAKRDYIQPLRLLEDFPDCQVTAAVQDAVALRSGSQVD